MREILLYHPGRNPAYWTALVRPRQYSVFLTDVETSAPIHADGTSIKSAASHYCLVFDSLANAEFYCREAVSKVPSLKCEVFDSAGRVNAPVAIFVNEQPMSTTSIRKHVHDESFTGEPFRYCRLAILRLCVAGGC
jgi:hypothetical protein